MREYLHKEYCRAQTYNLFGLCLQAPKFLIFNPSYLLNCQCQRKYCHYLANNYKLMFIRMAALSSPILANRRERKSVHSTTSRRSYRSSVHVESNKYLASWQSGPPIAKSHGGSLKRKNIRGLPAQRVRRNSDSASVLGESRATSVPGEWRDRAANVGKESAGGMDNRAADFDKLLVDPVGLQNFSEFLKKEFSVENIRFWIACQQFGRVEEGGERLRVARRLVERHLSPGAADPVNVDSVAVSRTLEQLGQASEADPPPQDLFHTAQTQIYNLMKFDSFSRFLKSDLYKDFLATSTAQPRPAQPRSTPKRRSGRRSEVRILSCWPTGSTEKRDMNTFEF